jgi:type II secretory pathway predicted ATPase ExeA
MYEAHFGLRQRPFRVIPDSDCYYPATSHEQALAQLLQAIAADEGLAVLTGAPGTGKTLLCHCLLERLGQDVTIAYLTNSHVEGRAGLLQAILYDLSQPYAGRTEQELRLALTEFLLENYRAGRRTVLIVDEAQNLPPDLLEELRLLGNLEGRQGRAVQVVLVGQPSLLETLRLPSLAAFAQRLAVRARLESLGVHEAADYLVHHLRTAGGSPADIITDEALEVLARGTQGLPRLLTRAAHQALVLAHAADNALVDAEAALEALAALGLADEGGNGEVLLDAFAPDRGFAALTGDEDSGDGQVDEGPRLVEESNLGASPETFEEAGRRHRLFATPRRPA